MGDGFEAMWEPLIGPRATAEFRRTSLLSLVMPPSGLVGAVAFGVLIGRQTIIAVVIAVGVVTTFLVWVHSLARLAAGMSEWYGVRIRWWELPRMRTPEQVEAWRQRRGLLPRDRA